jgi:solute carrier family 30 (zinc transporter), member 5/7
MPDLSQAGSTIEQLTNSVLDENANRGQTISPGHGALQACALASITLLVLGGYGKLRSHTDDTGSIQEVRDDSDGKYRQRTKLATVKEVTLRAVSVGLPFFAAIKLGGQRVGLSTLVAAVASVFPDRTLSKPRDTMWVEDLKRILTTRPMALTFFILSLLLDGFASTIVMADFFQGYFALFLSIFAFAPSFIGKAHRATESPISPLISSRRHTTLTLLTGAALGIISLLLSILYDVFPHDFSSSSMFAATALTGAMSLNFSIPSSMQSGPSFGLIIGSCLSLIPSLFFSYLSWEAFIMQTVLTIMGYGAVQLDSRKKIEKHSHEIHHHECHTHLREDRGPSTVSKALLRVTRELPLLHSILAERDSRRIFYFML